MDHVCVFGKVERSIMAGTLHRKCVEFWCDIVTLDIDEDEDEEGTG